MNITIVKTVTTKKPVLDEEGKHEKKSGVLQYTEEETTEDVEFETHPHELIGSCAVRAAKSLKMPEPPRGIRPTLAHVGNLLPTNPDFTMKAITTPVADPTGKKRFVITRW